MRIQYDGKRWDVWLQDDGTMDTVISVQPIAIRKQYAGQRPEYWPSQYTRFDCEYASVYRRPNGEMTMRGLRILGLEAINDYMEDIEL